MLSRRTSSNCSHVIAGEFDGIFQERKYATAAFKRQIEPECESLFDPARECRGAGEKGSREFFIYQVDKRFENVTSTGACVSRKEPQDRRHPT